MTDPIRVVVVDDHSMVRGGLRLFLIAFDDMALVGEAANGLEAVQICEQVQPDVVLMDIIMPGMDGIRATQEIVKRSPQIRIIALTSFLEADLLQEALVSGAAGVLSKDISASELVQAIRKVHAGQYAFSPQVEELFRQTLKEAAQEPPAPPPNYELTSREMEVLQLMVNGLSNAEIARRLVISLSTAKYHVSSILNKMHAANRGEAISLALQHHLVDVHQAPSQPES